MSLTFTEPVIARMHGPDGEPALLEISNVRDGLAAIRHDLGCGQCSTTEWQRAVDRLVKAALNPSSACIEEARLGGRNLGDLLSLR